MADTQYTIVSLRELNTKLTVEISELRKKYAELEAKNIKVEAENAKLKQDKEEVEARFLNLEQRDREKTGLIAKLKHDVSLIKEQSLQNGGNGYTDNASDDAEYRTSDSDIYQVKDNHISQSSKNKVQKFMAEVSKNSSSSISNADNDVIPTTLNKTESQPSNNSFTFLYEKLCNAIILADRKIQEAILCYCNFGKALIQRRNELASEKQVDPESNAVSRILNKEVRMDKIYQIHSFSTDSISKMTNKDIQYIIDNIPFDYSIKIEPALKSEFSEPSSGSDQQISCKKENKDSEFSETKVTTTITSSILLSHTFNSGDKLSNDRDSDSSEVKIQVSVPDDEDSNYDYDDEDFSDDNNEDDDKDDRSFCGFSDDDEGYYYDLNTGETYTKSEHRYSIHDLGLDVTGLDGVELGGAGLDGAGLDGVELGGAGLDGAGLDENN
ncbi:19863_t:CDS:2, partial [Racocetra persica]